MLYHYLQCVEGCYADLIAPLQSQTPATSHPYLIFHIVLQHVVQFGSACTGQEFPVPPDPSAPTASLPTVCLHLHNMVACAMQFSYSFQDATSTASTNQQTTVESVRVTMEPASNSCLLIETQLRTVKAKGTQNAWVGVTNWVGLHQDPRR